MCMNCMNPDYFTNVFKLILNLFYLFSSEPDSSSTRACSEDAFLLLAFSYAGLLLAPTTSDM